MSFQEKSLTNFSHLQITEQSSVSVDKETTERDTMLRRELESVQNLNKIIEKTVSGLTKAQENMEIVDKTVKDADKLLELWIKILNQTEHTQQLVLNKRWHGATKDLLDIENELSKTIEQPQEIKSFQVSEKKISAKEAKKELSNMSYLNNSGIDNEKRMKKRETTKTYIRNKKTTVSATNKENTKKNYKK
ncbi:hypothetical protein PMAC_000164 [Pneumocystis sp. 'macacae']|nr:hypothetical protein PMAC_000164 [Pneumocystis sp. 'macacae']